MSTLTAPDSSRGELELLRELGRLALGEDQVARLGRRSSFEGGGEAGGRARNALHARRLDARTERRDLLASDALKIAAHDLRYAQVVLQQCPVHGGLVLSVHDDLQS